MTVRSTHLGEHVYDGSGCEWLDPENTPSKIDSSSCNGNSRNSESLFLLSFRISHLFVTMRLYNSKSCTPVGDSSSKRARWSPPKAFVPSRPLGDNRTRRSPPSSFSRDFRDDESDFPEDEASSPMSCLSPNNLHRRTLRRNRSFGVSMSFPKTTKQWLSGDYRKNQVRRQASWSPSKSNVPFLVMRSDSAAGKTSFKLHPRYGATGRKNEQKGVLDLLPLKTSKSILAEPSMAFGYKLSPTESTSDDSSDAWLDFSLDGSENPFQTMNCPATPLRFLPIEKAPHRRTLMTIKPTPVQRTRSSHSYFPVQNSRKALSFCPRERNETSAFVVPAGSFFSGSLRQRECSDPKSTPRLAPCPRDVEPIRPCELQSQAGTPPIVDLAKYSSMLKSKVPFDLVRKIMEREGVDAAIIELAVLASNVSNL